MADQRLDPPHSLPTYAVRAPNSRWLEEEARRAHAALGSWRWTHAGLERLFTENGDWSSVRVTPSSGTTACVAMIVSINVHIFFRRLRLGFVARPLVSALNGVAEIVDSRSKRLRTPEQPGTLFANFHVVAEVPR